MFTATKLVWAGATTGLVFGAALALLLAPTSGEELRRKIALWWKPEPEKPESSETEWTDEWSDAADDIASVGSAVPPSTSDFGELEKPADLEAEEVFTH
ncbi:MAG TPA: YtxH domain-containing protein [Polyangiaceae bacterium]|jgi:gas vesicle protein|nr:YtxH domain-containing protein [Polyangiaceae bacterium]